MAQQQPPDEGPVQPALASDLVPESNHVPAGPIAKFAYLLGSAGLLGATAADSLAVAGRHTGWHLLGSIELVQAAVVVLASAGMLAVTIGGGHASVHMVTERLSQRSAERLHRLAHLLSALVFLVLAAGSVWLLAELWDGHEQTELLHIPLRWLRLLWIVFAVLIAGYFFRNAFRRAAA